MGGHYIRPKNKRRPNGRRMLLAVRQELFAKVTA